MVEHPVLFIGFNRPDLATLVLDRLRECGVRRLYIALDGPRSGHPTDTEHCRQMRELVDSVDWAESKVLLIREENLGCGLAVSGALDWFFRQEEKGIIIEDDCLPDPTFFQFCEEMLIRYADNPNVWSVAGFSITPELTSALRSHFSSKYFKGWGWATWRRVWENYIFDMSSVSTVELEDVIARNCKDYVEQKYWFHMLQSMKNGRHDTWDFQFQYCSWKHDGLHITSAANLVSNLGFRSDATHTKSASSLADRQCFNNPPPYDDILLQIDEQMDRFWFIEQLHESNELVPYIFQATNDIQTDLINTAEKQRAYISELEDHLSRRAFIIEELDQLKKVQLNEIQILRNELEGYRRPSGFLKSLKNLLRISNSDR